MASTERSEASSRPDSGADAEKRKRTQQKFLAACVTGDVDGVKSALATGLVDVDGADDDGWTALMIATQRGAVAVIEALLAAGANPSKDAPATGLAPVYIAASEGNAAALQVLLDGGAEAMAKNRESGMDALTVARTQGKSEAAAVLERYLQAAGEEMLLAACAGSSVDIVQRLLDRQSAVQIHAVDADGRSALWHAARRGDASIVKLLIERGAVVSTGQSPLAEAVRGGHVEAARALTDAGASVSGVDRETGLDFLRLAFSLGHKAMYLFLQDKSTAEEAQARALANTAAAAMAAASSVGALRQKTQERERFSLSELLAAAVAQKREQEAILATENTHDALVVELAGRLLVEAEKDIATFTAMLTGTASSVSPVRRQSPTPTTATVAAAAAAAAAAATSAPTTAAHQSQLSTAPAAPAAAPAASATAATAQAALTASAAPVAKAAAAAAPQRVAPATVAGERVIWRTGKSAHDLPPPVTPGGVPITYAPAVPEPAATAVERPSWQLPSEDLPEGWVRVWSERAGTVCYANILTGTRSWDKPYDHERERIEVMKCKRTLVRVAPTAGDADSRAVDSFFQSRQSQR